MKSDFTVKISCDTSELDAALTKVDLLVSKTEDAVRQGLLPVGMLAALAIQVEAKKTTRRDLLFWWRR
jgi:hypothetical protein